MKARSSILTKEERDVLILATPRASGYLSNSEIAQRLGISVNRVKTIMHQAFLKLGAHNRCEAIFLAMKRGDIGVNEFYSLDELLEIAGSVCPDALRRIAHIVRHGLKHRNVPGKDEQIICMERRERRQGTTLTNKEREVLILAARGLTNTEIADILYISVSSVRTFLYRAYAKLGKHNRADAAILAIKRGEISLGDIISLSESVQFLTPLGAESIEEMAQLLNRKLGQEPIPTFGVECQ